MFSWSFTEDYRDVIIEQSTVALTDRGYLDQLTEDVLELPEVLLDDLTARSREGIWKADQASCVYSRISAHVMQCNEPTYVGSD